MSYTTPRPFSGPSVNQMKFDDVLDLSWQIICSEVERMHPELLNIDWTHDKKYERFYNSALQTLLDKIKFELKF